MRRHKSTIACDISPAVRRAVMERDDGRCIICGSTNGIQLAHYVSRARMGRGIETNLVCLCHRCHADYDQGKYHGLIGTTIMLYFKEKYGEEWCTEDQYYRKGQEL